MPAAPLAALVCLWLAWPVSAGPPPGQRTTGPAPAAPVPADSPAAPVPSAISSAPTVPAGPEPAPEHPLRLRLAVDVPVVALGLAIGLGSELAGKEQVWTGCAACDVARINALDRGVIGNADHAARTYSDIGLYTAVALPFALDLGDALLQRARDGSAARSRHMRGWAIDAVVLLETFAVTYAATNLVKFAVRRPRPYSYDADSEVGDPTANDARLSFFSGHSSLSFAMAAAYASLFAARHPRSRWVAPVWVIGMTLASTTAIARVAAGKHFWTDILVGAAVGSATGVAIPALHRRRTTDPHRRVTLGLGLAPGRTGSLLLVQGRF